MQNLGESSPAIVSNQSRGRKRQRQEHTWGKNIRKLSRSTGKEYVNTRGYTVPAKVFAAAECTF